MAFLDHPNYKEIEKERTKVFKKFKDKQKERKDGGGHHLQCVLTPPADADGATLQTFDESRKAGHEADDWTALDIHQEVKHGVFCQYYQTRYEGPAGEGHINGARVVYDGDVWVYEEHWGPEDRSGPFDVWQIVSDEA